MERGASLFYTSNLTRTVDERVARATQQCAAFLSRPRQRPLQIAGIETIIRRQFRGSLFVSTTSVMALKNEGGNPISSCLKKSDRLVGDSCHADEGELVQAFMDLTDFRPKEPVDIVHRSGFG